MANRFYPMTGDNAPRNPFDNTILTPTTDEDAIAAFLGVSGEQGDRIYNNITGVRNYSSTTPLVIWNKTINYIPHLVLGDRIQIEGGDVQVQFVDGNSGGRIVFSPLGQGEASDRFTEAQLVAAGIGAGYQFFIGGTQYTVNTGTPYASVSGGTRAGVFVTPDPTANAVIVGDIPTNTAQIQVTPGNLNAAVDGAHVFLVNCRISIDNSIPSRDARTSYTPFSARNAADATVTGGFQVGTLTGSSNFNRPGNVSNQAGSRGIHAFGCQFSFTGIALENGTRANLGLATVENCSFVNESEGSVRYYFHANSNPGDTTAYQDGATYDNRVNGPNNFVNFHSSNYTLRNPEFIGCAPFTNGATTNTNDAAIILENYANPSPFEDAGGRRYYGIGNRNANPHGFYSINAATRIPLADLTSPVVYNDNGTDAQNEEVINGVVVEASRYKPTFFSTASRDTNRAQSVKIFVDTNHDIGTDGNPHSISQTARTTARQNVFISDADGRIAADGTDDSGNTVFNPFDASTTVTFDQGLILPTVSIRGDDRTNIASASTSMFTGFTNTIRLRGLFHLVDTTTGEKSYTITQATEEARTNSGVDIEEEDFFPINTALSQTLQDGAHTETTFDSHITSTFTNTSNISEQIVYDVIVRQFYDNTTSVSANNINWPVASAGGFTWTGNLALASALVTTTSFSNGELTLRGTSFQTDTEANTQTMNITGTVALSNNSHNVNLTATTLTDPRLVTTLDNNRQPQVSLNGTIGGTLQVNSGSNAGFLILGDNLVGASSTDPLIISNGAGNAGVVTVAGTSAPSPGSSYTLPANVQINQTDMDAGRIVLEMTDAVTLNERVTVNPQNLPNGAIFIIRQNGINLNTGIVDDNTVSFQYASDGSLGTDNADILTHEIELHYVLRNGQCGHSRVQALENTSFDTYGAIREFTLEPASVQFLSGVDATNIANTGGASVVFDGTVDSMNRVTFDATGSTTNIRVTEAQSIAAGLNGRNTQLYLSAVIAQIEALDLTWTSDSAFYHDVVSGSATSFDLREGRYIAGDNTDVGSALFPGWQVTNDNQSFTTTERTSNDLINITSVLRDTTGEPQVIIIAPSAAPTAEQNAAVTYTQLRPDLVNIGLNVPILTENGNNFDATPNTPDGGS